MQASKVVKGSGVALLTLVGAVIALAAVSAHAQEITAVTDAASITLIDDFDDAPDWMGFNLDTIAGHNGMGVVRGDDIVEDFTVGKNLVGSLDDWAIGGVITDVQRTTGYVGSDFVYTCTLDLEEHTGAARTFTLRFDAPPDYPFQLNVMEPTVILPANGIIQTNVRITVPASAISSGTWLDSYQVNLLLAEGGVDVDGVTLEAAVPLPARPHPRLLLDADDFVRIENWTTAHDWAADARDDIIRAADDWPTVFTETYYLNDWALPPEGGQWIMWYVCPEHGVPLRYEGPGRHVCPVDGTVYSGWPYEQVVYTWMHLDLGRVVLKLAQAYQLTGDVAYAQQAAEILLAYADIYLSYPIHDNNNENTRNGGRVHSQTLFESMWCLAVTWAYDLIADAPVLTDADRAHIERDMLYEAVEIIERNPVGMSNHQSWHNVGIGVVGFALEDPVLVAQAIRDPDNGFEYQMEASVSKDGFWYEGTWHYHFVALEPLTLVAEMAAHAGLDLYANPKLRTMFETPLHFALPGWTMPPFNNSGDFSLIWAHFLYYEIAYSRYGDPFFTTVLRQRPRSEKALFWSAETLPDAVDLDLRSIVFPDTGYAALRNTEGDDLVYLALDFGPHGGGHGHYDKLGFVLHARGEMMGVDPGMQSYAAPTHETWDKVTVAHNTVVVDGRSQDGATGGLHRFAALPGLAMVAADAGQAYPTADLLRTIVVSSDYVLDRYRVRATDGQPHAIDWVYHNFGTLTTTLPLTTCAVLPSENGYQHLVNPQATATDVDWEVTFDMTKVPGSDYGSVWASRPVVTGTFTYNQDEAANGSGSGQLTYDFSKAAGYIMYIAESPDRVEEAPAEVRLALYGDGSDNVLNLRLYDHAEEQFTKEIGPIDWTGWRVITVTDVVSWAHDSGDNNSIFNPPASQVAVQISYGDVSPITGTLNVPVTGTLYVDDITLFYPEAGESTVEDFEIRPRGLRLWMLGEPGVTVVTGEGLGPDLLEPVPFAMARRTAQTTTFAALLEPIGATPVISAFAALPTDAPPEDEAVAFTLTATSFVDRLLAVADGAPGARRTFGDAACDGALCLVRRSLQGELMRLVLADGEVLEDAGTPLLVSGARLDGLQVDYGVGGTPGTVLHIQLHVEGASGLASAVRIWGPEVTMVLVNDTPRALTRDGDYVVLAADYVIHLPLVQHSFSGACGEILTKEKIWQGGLDWSCDSAIKTVGAVSLKMQADTFSIVELYSPLIPVRPNQVYEVSYWVKTDLEVDGADLYGRVVAAQYNAQDKESDEVNENRLDSGFTLGESVGGQTDWVFKSYTFTTGAETAYVRLRAMMGGQVGTARGEMWLDQVAIRE